MMNWWERAACRDADPDLFFPQRPDGRIARKAKQVCATCPVIEQCLQEALRRDDPPHGVWGGLSEGERRRLKRSQVA